MQRCRRCFKNIREAYYFNGLPYGSECIYKVSGQRAINIRRRELEHQYQIELDYEAERDNGIHS